MAGNSCEVGRGDAAPTMRGAQRAAAVAIRTAERGGEELELVVALAATVMLGPPRSISPPTAAPTRKIPAETQKATVKPWIAAEAATLGEAALPAAYPTVAVAAIVLSRAVPAAPPTC